MYYGIIKQFATTLKNLDACLTKAEAHAESRGFDVNNYLGTRLYPDMLPFVVQIRIACDQAKYAAANLSGKAVPKHPDTERTFAELHGRIRSTLEFVESCTEEDLAKVDPARPIAVPYPAGQALRAEDYLLSRQVPQFFFHVSIAYALLRHGGVDLGKADYLGQLSFVPLPVG